MNFDRDLRPQIVKERSNSRSYSGEARGRDKINTPDKTVGNKLNYNYDYNNNNNERRKYVEPREVRDTRDTGINNLYNKYVNKSPESNNSYLSNLFNLFS